LKIPTANDIIIEIDDSSPDSAKKGTAVKNEDRDWAKKAPKDSATKSESGSDSDSDSDFRFKF
jgi:hypothetical protein